MEDALWVTPRSLHRHLAEYKLIFKSRMGKNVQGDMIRFQVEPIFIILQYLMGFEKRYIFAPELK